MKSNRLIVGLLAGTAVLSVLGIVYLELNTKGKGYEFNPLKGKSGKKLKSKLDRFLGLADDKINSVKKEAGEFIETRKARNNETIAKVKDAVM